MKEFLIKILPLSVLMLLCSCSDSTVTEEPAMPEGRDHFITESMASEIADEALIGFFGSRSDLRSPVCEALTFEGSRAADFVSDTLAYVFNYPDSSGFVVVASDDRINPVLAFSDSGSFDVELTPTKELLVERLGFILASQIKRETGPSRAGQPVMYESLFPMFHLTLHQSAPYNRYVVEEHPGCPVGCAIVTAASIFVYSKDSIEYHGVEYDLNSIYNSLRQGSSVVGDEAYEAAVDSMAKIMYWLGKDLNASYSPQGTGAHSSDAQKLLIKLGYTWGLDYRFCYWPWIMQALRAHELLGMSVASLPISEDDERNWHSLLVDGAFIAQGGVQTQSYLHCLWGWNGYNDGFYKAGLFELSYNAYEPMAFYSIKPDRIK